MTEQQYLLPENMLSEMQDNLQTCEQFSLELLSIEHVSV